jgi:hypothetical protein
MADPVISGPYRKARAKADLDLANGDTDIDYRGISFSVVDNDRGWTYYVGRQEFASLEEVFDSIDAKLEASPLDAFIKKVERKKR